MWRYPSPMASYTAAAIPAAETRSQPNVPRPMAGILAPPATTRCGTRAGSTGSRVTAWSSPIVDAASPGRWPPASLRATRSSRRRSPVVAIPAFGGRRRDGHWVRTRMPRGAAFVREAHEPQQPPAPLGHQPRVALGGCHPGGRRPDGAADEHARRARVAGRLDLALERRVVHPPRQQDPWQPAGLVQLGDGVGPFGRVVDGGITRELGLEDVTAERRQPAGGLDDPPPARLARELAARRGIEAEGLHEQGQVGRATGLDDVSHEPLLGGRVRGLVVVVDEQLGRGRPKALRLLHRPARQDPAHAGRRGALVTGRLDRNQEPGPAGGRSVRDALGGADLGVQERARRMRGERTDDCPLELDHLGVRDRVRGVRPELLAQVLAVIEREHREGPAWRGARLEPTPGAEEVGDGNVATGVAGHGRRTPVRDSSPPWRWLPAAVRISRGPGTGGAAVDRRTITSNGST